MGMRTMDYTREQNVIQWFIELWHVGRVRANPNEFCDAICRSSFEISADFLFFFLLHSKIYSNSTRKAVLIASENGQRIWNVCVCVSGLRSRQCRRCKIFSFLLKKQINVRKRDKTQMTSVFAHETRSMDIGQFIFRRAYENGKRSPQLIIAH